MDSGESSLFWNSSIGFLFLWFHRLIMSWFDRGLLDNPEISDFHDLMQANEQLLSSKPCETVSCLRCDKAIPAMSPLDELKMPYFERKPSQRLRRIGLSHLDAKEKYLNLKETHGTWSSLHGHSSFGDEPDLHTVAAEGPPELFNSSIFMNKIKKKLSPEAWHTNSKQYLWEGDQALPTASCMNLGRSYMREMLREADEELRPDWSFAPGPMLPGMKVIDCFSRHVVTAPPGCDYVALSYVWGSITSRRGDERFQVYLDEHSLPQTVQDAMNVVRVLGMQFLWVDRYCIDNTEPGMKHYMISNMDAIYAAAHVTIIAASGSDDEYGLPSVSGPYLAREGDYRRSFPPWDGIACTSLSSAHRKQIEQSAWSTRGWTYQEGLLSRRRLIFTDDCAILHFRGNDRVNSTSGIFFHINEYSRRDLTYPSDSLKASLGVFRAYEKLRPPAMHIWGVPFLLSSDGNVGQPGHGLLWRCDRRGCSLQRIQGLPSWTWAGWSGWSDRDGNHREFISHLCQFGPYHWLVNNARMRDAARLWDPSDISLEVLDGNQLRDISDHFRAGHWLPSEEPAPILYLTAWSTIVTALVLPEFSILLEGENMDEATAKFDSTVESLCNSEPQINGMWNFKWTAAVICWGVPGRRFNRLETQSLLLKRVGEDTFQRVGVLETDWLKFNLDEHGRTAVSGRPFARRRLRIV